MTAPDYINMIKEHPRWKDNHALIKTCIDFDKKNVKIEPYVFGLWIGDGDKDTCRFTNEDSEVIDYLKEYSKIIILIIRLQILILILKELH